MASSSLLRRFFGAIDLSPMLRATGFESVNILKQRLWNGRNDPENPKVVLDGSRWHALSRNTVHILPVAVLVTLIAFSYSHYYIGPNFVEDPERNGLFSAGIQVCAKLEELLCIASLTMIVLHALRHELLDEGVPIGLLGSAIWFTSLASFWSPDFIGSFSWVRPSWRNARFCFKLPVWQLPWSRIRLYLLLFTSGLIAATIGPASAVLMLPREQSIPAGGSSFFLYGTSDQFYPDIVTATSEPEFCTLRNATEYDFCPSGGWKSLSHTMGTFSYPEFEQRSGGKARFNPQRQAKGAEGNRAWDNFLIQSPRNVIPHVMNSVRSRYASDYNTVAIQPHAATAAVMQKLRGQWMDGASQRRGGASGQYKWTYNLQTLGSAMSPWVRTKCGTAQNLSADADTASFPFLSSDLNNVGWAFRVDPADSFKNHTIIGLHRKYSSQIRAQWLPLPVEEFGAEEEGFNTTGLLIELPWSDDSRAAVACGISAAWHNGTVRSERSEAYGAWSIALSMFDWGPHDDSPSFIGTNIPVTLDESWLRLLTPLVPLSNSESSAVPLNTLETILDNSGITELPSDIRAAAASTDPGGVCIPEKAAVNASDVEAWRDPACFNTGYYFIEQAIAMVVADGLSRFSSWRVMNLTTFTTLEVPTFNRSQMLLTSRFGQNANRTLTTPDSTTGWFAVFVTGWSYYPNKISDRLALAPIIAYLLLVLLYIIYTVFWISERGHGTSASWDSVTELLVLCQNSAPPTAPNNLTNTSAGIEHLKTFRNVVKVRAFQSPDGTGPPSLRLMLDGDSSARGSSTAGFSSSRSRSRSCKPGKPPEGSSSTLLTTVSTTSISPARPQSTYQRDQGQRVQMDRKYG